MNEGMRYAVQEFDTEFNLGLSDNPFRWVESRVSWFATGGEALLYYSGQASPQSELLKDEEGDGILDQLERNRTLYSDPSWVEENRL